MDRNDEDVSANNELNSKTYQRMNEKEKDAAIARSIIRLQSKIQEIMYLTNAEMLNEKNPGTESTPKQDNTK